MSSRIAVSRPVRAVLASLCAAVLSAVALTVPGSADAYESHKQPIDTGNSLNAVSCVPRTTDCVVSDSKGNALYSTDVTTSGAATWKLWSGPIGAKPSEAVACPSSSLCVLADGEAAEPPGGNVYYASSLGGSWTEAFSPVFGVDALSCASVSLCLTGQGEGYVRYATTPASEEWNVPEQEHKEDEPIASGRVDAVDCLSTSFCAIVDSSGSLYVADSEAKIKEKAGWESTDIDGSALLDGIACTSTSSCLAIDDTGNVIELAINANGEATSTAEEVDPSHSLTAITCAGFSCAAVDSAGRIFVSGDSGASWVKRYETASDLTSVSCASSELCVAANTAGEVTAFDLPPTKHVLTVVLSGEGKVESDPAGIACEAEECSHEFEGSVTLTATTPKPGYVFAGWIGCKHLTADTCEVQMTAASEVTAVFLKEPAEGKAGKEGATGKEGPTGKEGASGPTGTTGPTGANGATGAIGTAGPQGQTGAQGPPGPAGKIEVVTCTKKGKKQKCTAKLVSGTVKFEGTTSSAHATLSRHGAVYAVGSAASVRGHLSLQLTPLHSLRPGTYTLTLISGAGRHETIRNEAFTLS